MNCDKIKQELSAWLDGELPEHEAEWVAEHISECETCRNELRELERMKEMLGDLPRETAPPGVATNVIDKIDNSTAGEKSRAGIARRFWPAAAAAIIAVVCLVAYRTDRDLSSLDEAIDGVAAPMITEDMEYAARPDESTERPRREMRHREHMAPAPETLERDRDFLALSEAQMEEAPPIEEPMTTALMDEQEELPITHFALATDEPQETIAKLNSSLRRVGGRRGAATPPAGALMRRLEAPARESMDARSAREKQAPEAEPPIVMTLRVPADKYAEFLVKLAGMGELTAIDDEYEEIGADAYRTAIAPQTALEMAETYDPENDEEYIELTIRIVSPAVRLEAEEGAAD